MDLIVLRPEAKLDTSTSLPCRYFSAVIYRHIACFRVVVVVVCFSFSASLLSEDDPGDPRHPRLHHVNSSSQTLSVSHQPSQHFYTPGSHSVPAHRLVTGVFSYFHVAVRLLFSS